ncbi:hypothetical protein AHiyo1_43800 [Arthrobacter sp. Hiyo1]|uniref:hypothetical protein n=1 Tax=Arthrobacter sp. Hiyo1 TaxID=1588020 RepID=UPI0006A36310|nr:hypothetical protein [Arthrobacter sp. Hiyo1]GAP60791.1 hypothetical protein AHiyo1_43800 [Arthrobacter sp. Hiyo1]
MVLTYDDMLVMLDDDDQEDEDNNLDELRDVPLLQLSQKQRDAVFRDLQVKLDEAPSHGSQTIQTVTSSSP